MAVELIGILKAGVDAFEALKLGARVALMQALLTSAMLLAAYTGLCMVRDGSVALGFRDAFLTPMAAGVAHEGRADSATVQGELRHVAASDRVIRAVLGALLDKAPGAARVRLAVIHGGTAGLSGLNMLRFDVTHAVAQPGRSAGDLVENAPLSNWSEYISTMLAGQCVLLDGSKLQNAASRARLEALGIRYFMGCPVVDIGSQMLGGVFLSWDDRESVPAGADLRKLMDLTLDAGRQLATALDLRMEH